MLDHFIVLDGVIVSSAIVAVTIARGVLELLLGGMTRELRPSSMQMGPVLRNTSPEQAIAERAP